METIVGIAAATPVANQLVALFKLAYPDASSSNIALIALLAGEVAAIAVTAANNALVFSQQGIASVFLTGVFAAAAAAGISRTDNRAEANRTTDHSNSTPTE